MSSEKYSSTELKTTLPYYPQLDSVRAIAVLLVLLSHFIVHGGPLTGVQCRLLGELGVDSFFVLSGFLITSILLKSKQKIDNRLLLISAALKQFYLRRTLRIFPIYYLLVLVLAVLSLYHYRIDKTTVLAAATYTINILVQKRHDWGELTGHYWSLAVEEQFYLVWPFIILLVKRNWLLPVIIFVITGSVLYGAIDFEVEFSYISTPACLSALGLGGLFALVKEDYSGALKIVYRVLALLAIAASCVFIYLFANSLLLPVPQRNVTSFMALFVIASVVLHKMAGRKNPAGWIFNSAILQFIGRISYGIYLYHFIVVYAFDFVARKVFHHGFLVWRIEIENPFLILLNFAAVILVSWLSYKFIEQPILKLKERL